MPSYLFANLSKHKSLLLLLLLFSIFKFPINVISSPAYYFIHRRVKTSPIKKGVLAIYSSTLARQVDFFWSDNDLNGPSEARRVAKIENRSLFCSTSDQYSPLSHATHPLTVICQLLIFYPLSTYSFAIWSKSNLFWVFFLY